MLPKIFKPFKSDIDNLIRIGPKKDGGYVIDKRVVKKTNKSGIPQKLLEAYPELDPTNPRDYLKLKRLQRQSPIDLALNDGGDQ